MKWHAYRVVSQKERVAASILRDRYGLNAWCPTEKRYIRKVNGRKGSDEREYALLVGYILVQAQAWWHPLCHHLILTCVGAGGVPTAISEQAIQRLKAISGSSLPHAGSVNMRTSFAAGDMARIVQGPLAGYEARVESVTGKNARLLLGLLGRDAVEIPVKSLEAA